MRTYPLPRRFLYAELLIYSLIGTLLLVAWIPAILSIITYGSVFKSALRAAFFLNLTASTLIVFVLFVKKELRRVKFVITEEYLGFQSASRGKKIRIATISSFSMLRFPLGGGVLIVDSADGTLSIPLMIERCSDLVSRLREYHTAGISDETLSNDWESILRTCRLTETTTERSLRVFRSLYTTCIVALPLNMIIGAVYWDMSIVPLILWAIAGALFPLATYGSADIILRLQTSRLSKKNLPLPDASDELRIFSRAGLAGLLLFLVCGILYRTIVL
ncbi:MAG: hypothetical protein JW863_12960 [Chitinispirillaceae bacterium]|nr:hypothetical protein [Chitinispirillaceae bacterium]